MIISQQWIEEMLMFAQRDDVGAVGAKLYYPEFKIKHAGILLGNGGLAGHYYYHNNGDSSGYMGRLCYVQNLIGVTGAGLIIQKSVFNKAGAFDEDLSVVFNDVDLCLKLRKLGYLNVWTPFAELYHYESVSRGKDDAPENKALFERGYNLMCSRWSKEIILGDPYYNPNLDLQKGYLYCKNESCSYMPRYCQRRTPAGYEYL